MNPFFVAFNAVAPIFAMILLGFFAKKMKFIGEAFVNQAMKFVFRISLPIMIYLKILAIDMDNGLTGDQISLMLLCGIGALVGYAMARAISVFVLDSPMSERGHARGAFMQGSFRSNYILIGYPVLLNLYGDDIVVRMALVTLVIIPMFNILTIMAMTPIGSHRSLNEYRRVVTNILKNPLIIAVILGFISARADLTYPTFIMNFLNTAGSMATPLALVAIGAFFHFDGLRVTLKPTLMAALIKLLVLPMVVTVPAYLLGFGELDVVLICVLLGGPTAVSSFAMSKEMGGDAVLSGNIVILTSALCMLTYVTMIAGWLQVFR